MAPSLRRVLIVPYVALVLLVAAAIGFLSYRTGSEAVSTILENQLLETSGRISQAVDRHIVGSGAVLEAAFPEGMAAPVSIKDDLADLRTRFWIATSLHIDLNNYVYYGNRGGQFFGLVRETTNDGQLRVKYRPEDQRTISDFNGIHGALTNARPEGKFYEPRERPWFKKAEVVKRHTWTSVYIDFRTDELVATRARRVLDAKGQFEGVVATDVSLRALNDFVRRLHVSKHGLAFIMETDGKLIASSASPYLRNLANGTNVRLNAAESGNPLIERMCAEVRAALAADRNPQLPQTRVFDGPEGEPIYAAFDRVEDDAGLEWITVVAAPRSDFMGAIRGNVLRTGLVALAAAVLAVLIGFGILEWVARDLKRLTEAARKVGEGEFESPVGINRRDEIGALAKSFEVMQERLRTDRLTGLANREALTRRVDGEVARRKRERGAHPFGLLFVDLDRFKLINDRYGHDAGDRVLVETARRLKLMTRPSDLVARYAGDEFVIYVDDASDREALLGLCARIERALCEPLELPDGAGTVVSAASVGLATFPHEGDDSSSLLAYADRQMYKRKFVSRA